MDESLGKIETQLDWKVFVSQSAFILQMVALAAIIYHLFGTDIMWIGDQYSWEEIPIAVFCFLWLFFGAYTISNPKHESYSLQEVTWSIIFFTHCILLAIALLSTPLTMYWLPQYWLFTVSLTVSTIISVRLKNDSLINSKSVVNRMMQYLSRRPAKSFIVCLTMFLSISGLFLILGQPTYRFPDIEGTLVDYRKDATFYDFKTGTDIVIPNPHKTTSSLYLLGSGPDRSLILKAHLAHNGNWRNIEINNDAAGNGTSKPLYLYSPFDNSLSLISELNDSNNTCDRIDYNGNTNSYLFSGTFQSDKGLFLLDSTFQLIDNYTSLIETIDERLTGRGFQVSSTEILYATTHDAIYLIDIESQSMELISRLRLCGISDDRQLIIISRDWKHESDDLILINLMTRKETVLNFAVKNLRGITFSPDNRYLIIRNMTYNLTDTQVNYLYDIESGEVTKMGYDGRAIWLPQRHPSFLTQ